MSVLLWVFAAMTQEADRPLTREAVEKARGGDLKGVEIALVEHSGNPKDGTSITIQGNGSVIRSWSAYYPLTPAETTESESLRLPLVKADVVEILKGFTWDDVLSLPRIHPGLVEPAAAWPKTLRYTLRLRIAGVGVFEGEHPHVRVAKLPQPPKVRTLIEGIENKTWDLAKRIEQADRDFMSSDRMLALIRNDSACLTLEIHDIQGLWGGTSLRLRGTGHVQGVRVRPPRGGEKGMQLRNFEGAIGAEEAAAVFRESLERKSFEVKGKREAGVPDEVRPVLVLRAVVDGATYSRRVWLWDGEARETPSFQIIRGRLQSIGEKLAK